MSLIARENGWRGFDGIGDKTAGGYEYGCDGMPTLMGCGESVIVTRRWTRVGVKKTRWFVCYGLGEDGEPALDVVLAFCPRCAGIVATQTPGIGPGSERNK
jgi:hypothetical protein